MSLDNHTPAERAAYRQALDTLAIALRQYHPASEVIGAFLESHPALPPLPVIERWVVVYEDGSQHAFSGPSGAARALDEVGHGGRAYRLAAVEEVTPTPEPVRVTLDGVVWTRSDCEKGWYRGSTIATAPDALSAALEAAEIADDEDEVMERVRPTLRAALLPPEGKDG